MWFIGQRKNSVFNLPLLSPFTIFAHSSRADVSFGGDGWLGNNIFIGKAFT